MRKLRGWTQAELAEAAELDLRFVQRIERGQAVPSLETLVGLADCLGYPIAELFKPAKSSPARRGRPPKAGSKPRAAGKR